MTDASAQVAISAQESMRQDTATKTYLITGGAGFLGINLVRYLLERGHTVASLDIADFDYPERDQIIEIQRELIGFLKIAF